MKKFPFIHYPLISHSNRFEKIVQKSGSGKVQPSPFRLIHLIIYLMINQLIKKRTKQF